MTATFSLIHGAWHEPSCWALLVPELERRGHRALTPDLPLHDPEAGYEERARPALQGQAAVTGRLVIVGHSQASPYASLAAAARRDAVLVHLCPRLGGFEPPPGAPDIFRPGFPFPADRPDGTSVWDDDAAIDAMYPRLPEETARDLARRLRPMAMPRENFPLAVPPGNRTVLIYAAEDELFEPDWERFMARELFGIEPIEIPGGHFPMVEDPAALADLLDRIAARPPNA